MTPLYLTLALWIGAVLTSVLLRTGVPEKKRDGKSSGEAEDTADGEAGGEADVKADSDADSDTEVNATAPGQNDASDEVTEYTRSQAFFGRFAIFACIGLAQSTLAVLGLIFFVQIDAAHPILLLVCGWVTSLVFMLIVYTLVLSFGSAGKAISVLLLVFQVSGAGGAYRWRCCRGGSRASAHGSRRPTRSTRCAPPSPVSTKATCGSSWACCCCSPSRC